MEKAKRKSSEFGPKDLKEPYHQETDKRFIPDGYVAIFQGRVKECFG
jgi:hypothetical protein